jgi:hypothetical protein
MNNELDSVWKEAVVTCLKVLSQYYLHGLGKVRNT